MSAFQKALDQVLIAEGGLVDNPSDKGGITNLGVTLPTLSRFLGRQATIAELKGLTPVTAAPIYKQLYWDAAYLDKFPEMISPAVFNQIVLRGQGPVIKSLQTALKLTPDGVVGTKTIEAVNTSAPQRLLFDFLRESHTAYIRICQRDPSQLIFLAGWSARVFELLADKFR